MMRRISVWTGYGLCLFVLVHLSIYTFRLLGSGMSPAEPGAGLAERMPPFLAYFVWLLLLVHAAARLMSEVGARSPELKRGALGRALLGVFAGVAVLLHFADVGVERLLNQAEPHRVVANLIAKLSSVQLFVPWYLLKYVFCALLAAVYLAEFLVSSAATSPVAQPGARMSGAKWVTALLLVLAVISSAALIYAGNGALFP